MRLAIVSALAANESLSFNELKAMLGTSDGNLSVHARKLEDAGYVACAKSFEGRMPRTVVPPDDRGTKSLRALRQSPRSAGARRARRAVEKNLEVHFMPQSYFMPQPPVPPRGPGVPGDGASSSSRPCSRRWCARPRQAPARPMALACLARRRALSTSPFSWPSRSRAGSRFFARGTGSTSARWTATWPTRSRRSRRNHSTNATRYIVSIQTWFDPNTIASFRGECAPDAQPARSLRRG